MESVKIDINVEKLSLTLTDLNVPVLGYQEICEKFSTELADSLLTKAQLSQARARITRAVLQAKKDNKDVSEAARATAASFTPELERRRSGPKAPVVSAKSNQKLLERLAKGEINQDEFIRQIQEATERAIAAKAQPATA